MDRKAMLSFCSSLQELFNGLGNSPKLYDLQNYKHVKQSSHRQSERLIHMFKSLAQVNESYFSYPTRILFFHAYGKKVSSRKLRMRKLHTKTIVGLDVVPE